METGFRKPAVASGHKLARGLLGFLTLGVAGPAAVAVYAGAGPLAGLPLALGTVLVGAVAFPVGPAAGLTPTASLATMALAGAGALFLVQEVLLAGESFKPVTQLVEEARRWSSRHPKIMALGPVSLLLAAFFLGSYFAAAIGWLFGWPRWRVFAFAFVGLMVAALVVAAVTSGASRLLAS